MSLAAPSPAPLPFARPYDGVKLAPSILKVRVIASARRPEDGRLWYTLQITPAPLSLPAKNAESVRLAIKRRPYTVYRRHADVVEFGRRLSESFRNRRPVVLVELPPIAATSDSEPEDEDAGVRYGEDEDEVTTPAERRRMELVDAIVQKVMRLPSALLQDKTVREFFGIWKSDVEYKLMHNLSDPVSLNIAGRAVLVDEDVDKRASGAGDISAAVASSGTRLYRAGTLPHQRNTLMPGDGSPPPRPSFLAMDLPQNMPVFERAESVGNDGPPSPRQPDAKRTISFGNIRSDLRRATTFFHTHLKRKNVANKHAMTASTGLNQELAPAVANLTRFPLLPNRYRRGSNANDSVNSSGSELSGLDVVDTGFLDEEGCPVWLRQAMEDMQVAKQNAADAARLADATPDDIAPARVLRRQRTAPALSIKSSSASPSESPVTDHFDGRRISRNSRHVATAGSPGRLSNGFSSPRHSQNTHVGGVGGVGGIVRETPLLLRSKSRSQHQLRIAAGPSPLSLTFQPAQDDATTECELREEALIAQKKVIRQNSLARLRLGTEQRQEGSAASSPALAPVVISDPVNLIAPTVPDDPETPSALPPLISMRATPPLTLTRRPSAPRLQRSTSSPHSLRNSTLLRVTEAIAPALPPADLVRSQTLRQKLRHKPMASFSTAEPASSAPSGSDSDKAASPRASLEIRVVMDRNALVTVDASRQMTFDDLLAQVQVKLRRCGHDEADVTGRNLVYRDAEHNVVRVDGDFALGVVFNGLGDAHKLTLFYI